MKQKIIVLFAFFTTISLVGMDYVEYLAIKKNYEQNEIIASLNKNIEKNCSRRNQTTVLAILYFLFTLGCSSWFIQNCYDKVTNEQVQIYDFVPFLFGVVCYAGKRCCDNAAYVSQFSMNSSRKKKAKEVDNCLMSLSTCLNKKNIQPLQPDQLIDYIGRERKELENSQCPFYNKSALQMLEYRQKTIQKKWATLSTKGSVA